LHNLGGKGAGAHPGTAGTGGHPETRGTPQGLSAPTVRRPAPAGDDRHGPGLRAGTADRRRADHGAGRDRAAQDPALLKSCSNAWACRCC
jgi:hypothetical protein